jgi:hypothetical protein
VARRKRTVAVGFIGLQAARGLAYEA